MYPFTTTTLTPTTTSTSNHTLLKTLQAMAQLRFTMASGEEMKSHYLLVIS